MAKVRFRDVKQGRTPPPKEKKKRQTKQRAIAHATLSERFKVFITDLFMIGMIPTYLVIYLVFGGREGFAEHRLLGWLLILIPYIIISSAFLIKTAQTPGMRFWYLRVVDSRTQGAPSFSAILLRQILGVWDFFLFTWIVQFFRKDHRTLHEILSGTALIQVSPSDQKAAS